MSVSYDSLWEILREKNMTKKDLITLTRLSPATIALMTNNKLVSMETIITICKALHCDIGNVIHLSTHEQSLDQAITEYVKQLDDPVIIKTAIENYMAKNSLSKNAFVRTVGISANTLQRLLACQTVNLSTYKKLMRVIDQEVMSVVDLAN